MAEAAGVRIRVVEYTGGPSPFDGEYVVDYDPHRPSEAPDGTKLPFHLVTTTDREKARVFPDAGAALDYYRQINGTRLDKKPNRPLTAWTVEIS